MNYIIKTLEPKRDQLFDENKRLEKQIQMFSNLVATYQKRYEENEEKIKQMDHVLDSLVYIKKPSFQ